MATTAFLVFTPYDNQPVAVNEAPLTTKSLPFDPFFPATTKLAADNYFPIVSWDLSSEQTLNIGSQSSGAGAGKITFNPLSIVRNVDRFSQTLFARECSGTAFQTVDLLIEHAVGHTSPVVHIGYRFGLCAVKSIDWSDPGHAGVPQEKITFEYGQLLTGYGVQNAAGRVGKFTFSGWDRVKNVHISTL